MGDQQPNPAMRDKNHRADKNKRVRRNVAIPGELAATIEGYYETEAGPMPLSRIIEHLIKRDVKRQERLEAKK